MGTWSAFLGHHLIGSGSLTDAVLAAKASYDLGEQGRIVLFEDETGAPLDLDLRGTPEEALSRVTAGGSRNANRGTGRPRGPGRPRLGVVAREVTLLPRHWEWLDAHPGGASATLRKLVEDARRTSGGAEAARKAETAVHRFMWDMAGDFAGFEEASRALFARDYAKLRALITDWPADVRDHIGRLVEKVSEAHQSDTRM